MATFLTTRQVADHINELSLVEPVREWQVRRVFEERLLPEPPKFGNKRMITLSQVPAIIAAMHDKGWLRLAEEATPA